MNPAFHPRVDWPTTRLAGDGQPEAAARDAAYRLIAAELDMAARIHGVRGWLANAPAEQIGAELLRCLVAADCWQARVPGPRRVPRGAAWRRYVAGRQTDLRGTLARSLAVAAVLTRVPRHWIPAARVQGEIERRLKPHGFAPAVLDLRLVPPVLGGDDWVQRHAGDGAARLAALDAAPVAALLHWPRRTEAAVVVRQADGIRAFGESFAPDGEPLDPAALASAFVFEPAAPPPSLAMRLARRLGLGETVWRWTRAWRHRRAGDGHAF